MHLIKYLFTLPVIIIVSCKKSETEKWDSNKEYIYESINETQHQQLVVKPNSVPTEKIIFFNSIYSWASPEELYFIGFENLISDYQVVSDMMLISGNFEEFLVPNEITIEYSHTFIFEYNTAYYQYYYHNDLQLYKIDHHDDVVEAITDMSMWSPVPFTFVDTTNVGLEGPGKIAAQITDVNALYVVARKIN